MNYTPEQIAKKHGLPTLARFKDKGIMTCSLDEDGLTRWYHVNGKKYHVKWLSGWEYWHSSEEVVSEILYFDPSTNDLTLYAPYKYECAEMGECDFL